MVLIIKSRSFILLSTSLPSDIMNNLFRDILTGLVFIIGVIGFIEGEFIISSALFAATTLVSNINMNRKKHLY